MCFRDYFEDTSGRAELIKTAFFGIFSISLALMHSFVSGVNGMCNDTNLTQ